MSTKNLFKSTASTIFFLFLLVSVILVNAAPVNKNQYKPTANAGDNQFAKPNAVVKLNASNSTDIDGNRLNYEWRILSKPQNSQAQLDNATKVAPLLPIDQPGVYQVELLVSDGLYNSTAIVEINTEETAPIIPKIYNQKILQNEVANLSAENVYDPDGDNLYFSWQLLQKPSDSQAKINDSNQSSALLITDKVGRYLVRLKVSDGKTTKSQFVNIISVDSMTSPINKTGIQRSISDIQCILDRISLIALKSMEPTQV